MLAFRISAQADLQFIWAGFKTCLIDGKSPVKDPGPIRCYDCWM
jgi:hypothetical protein